VNGDVIEAFASKLQLLDDEIGFAQEAKSGDSDVFVNVQKLLHELKNEFEGIHNQVLSGNAQQETIKSLEADLIKLRSRYESSLVIAAQEELNLVYSSLSWRITQPLRFTRMIFGIFISRSKLIPKSLISFLFQVLPPQTRGHIKTTAFSKAKTIFEGTRSYGAWKTLQDSIVIGFPTKTKSQVNVSIIIIEAVDLESIIRCLNSIGTAKNTASIELIVVDTCSSEALSTAIGELKNLFEIELSVNDAVENALGDYIFVVDGFVEFVDENLDELLLTFDLFEGVCGAVPMLVSPEGDLIRAGSMPLSKVKAVAHDYKEDCDEPRYNYAKCIENAGYIPILIKKTDFHIFYFTKNEDITSFRNSHAVDKKVFYQPLSRCIVHTRKGSEALSNLSNYESVAKIDMRANKKIIKQSYLGSILIIDSVTPTPDKDAGSVTSFYFMKLFIELGYHVTFIPADNFLRMEGYTANLQRIGVNTIYHPYFTNVEDYLLEHGKQHDVIMLYRVEYAAKFIGLCRELCPQAKIVFDTVDLHYLREMRQAEHENSENLRILSQHTKEREIAVMMIADETIVLSDIEKALLESESCLADSIITTIPLILDIPGRKKNYEERKDILFIGGYSHTPNVDAVVYFISKIWPSIKQKIPEINFYVLGSNPPQEILDLSQNGVHIIGFVEDLAEYFDRIKLSVVPLRYGAGIKGKIGSSLSYGVPVVSTSVGAEGMKIAGRGVQVGDDVEAFADVVVKMYTDESHWQDMSDAGLKFVDENYSLRVGKDRLNAMLQRLLP